LIYLKYIDFNYKLEIFVKNCRVSNVRLIYPHYNTVQVDRKLLEQKLETLEKQSSNMQVETRENVVTPSPGAATELINFDASHASIPASGSLVLNAVSPVWLPVCHRTPAMALR